MKTLVIKIKNKECNSFVKDFCFIKDFKKLINYLVDEFFKIKIKMEE